MYKTTRTKYFKIIFNYNLIEKFELTDENPIYINSK